MLGPDRTRKPDPNPNPNPNTYPAPKAGGFIFSLLRCSNPNSNDNNRNLDPVLIQFASYLCCTPAYPHTLRSGRPRVDAYRYTYLKVVDSDDAMGAEQYSPDPTLLVAVSSASSIVSSTSGPRSGFDVGPGLGQRSRLPQALRPRLRLWLRPRPRLRLRLSKSNRAPSEWSSLGQPPWPS